MQTKTPLIIVGTPGTDWWLLHCADCCINSLHSTAIDYDAALEPLPFSHVCAACVHNANSDCAHSGNYQVCGCSCIQGSLHVRRACIPWGQYFGSDMHVSLVCQSTARYVAWHYCCCIFAAGNSKTLSLKLAAERLRGEHGPYPFFRTFDAMDVFPYQCSEQSTSHVFLRLLC